MSSAIAEFLAGTTDLIYRRTAVLLRSRNSKPQAGLCEPCRRSHCPQCPNEKPAVKDDDQPREHFGNEHVSNHT